MHVLPSTWTFRCKRYPDGLIRKLKARFCVRGDRKIEGVDYFEAFAPVGQWETVRLLLILFVHLNLSTIQVDYTSAFLHTDIEHKVYVEIPRGYKDPGKALKLNNSLHGLKQNPRNVSLHLKSKLENLEFVQSPADPCLFIRPDIICLVYVDDCLFFALDYSNFEDMLQKLRNEDLTLEKEDDVAGFLGVHLKVDHDKGAVKLTQLDLIDRIIDVMGLTNATEVENPAEYGALPNDYEGESCNTQFNYSSIVGILLYLQNYSRLELTFAVSQYARYTYCPKLSHEKVLKRIGDI